MGKLLGKVGKDSDNINKLEEYNLANVENWESENGKLEQEKNKMEKVKQILENNPSLLETLNKLKSAENDKMNLEHWKDTNNVNMADYNQRMEKTEKLISERRNEISNYIAKNNLDISLDDIPEFSVKESLLEKLSDEIDNRDEEIKNNSSYISVARGVVSDIEVRSGKQVKDDNKDNQGQGQEKIENNVNINTVSEEKNEQIDNEPKWYQFAQRFKNWNEKRKVLALDAPENEQQQVKEDDEQTNSFIKSIQYNVDNSAEQTVDNDKDKDNAEQTVDKDKEQDNDEQKDTFIDR